MRAGDATHASARTNDGQVFKEKKYDSTRGKENISDAIDKPFSTDD